MEQMDTLELGQTQRCEGSTTDTESAGYTASCSGSNSSSSTPEQCAKRKRTGPSSRKRGRKSPPVSSSDDQLDSISTCQAPLKFSVVPVPVSIGQENVPPNIVVTHYNNIPSDQDLQIQRLQRELNVQIAINNHLTTENHEVKVENQHLKQQLGSQLAVVQSDQGVHRRSSMVSLPQPPLPMMKPPRKLLPKTSIAVSSAKKGHHYRCASSGHLNELRYL